MGNLSEFVNFNDMISNYESEEYIKLLERISNLHLTEKSEEPLNYSDNMAIELGDNAYLFNGTIGSVSQIAKDEVRTGKKLKYIGYPSNKGRAMGIIFPVYNLAITNKSKCKEGAYLFLEYCLLRFEDKLKTARGSNDSISSAGEFCTINRFIDQNMDLAKGKDFVGFMYEEDYHEFEINEDHVEMAKMVIDSGRAETILERKIRSIMLEEFDSFVNGSSDAEATAKKTQNRVQLLLNESR